MFKKNSIKVFFRFRIRNLLYCDVLSKSDPMCLVYIQLRNNQKRQEHGRTEVLKKHSRIRYKNVNSTSRNSENEIQDF